MPTDFEPEQLEAARLAALNALEALDAEPDPVLDALVAEAADACEAPISLVSFVTSDLQRVKARQGSELRSIPRDQAFCAYTIQADNVMLVRDAAEDPRFINNPLVKGDPHIRSYAAAPLVTASRHRVGALCVIDTQPRSWTARHERILQRLAAVAVRVLEAHVAAKTTATLNQMLEELILAERRFQAVFAGVVEGVVIQERDSTIIDANLSAERMLGLTRDQLLGRTSFDPRWQLTREDGSDLPLEEQPSMRCLTTGQGVSDQMLGLHLPSGERRWLRVSSQPFFKDGDTAPFRTATTFIDVTAQLEAANQLSQNSVELKQALSAAEMADQAKTAFLATMSHEIRTPLNAVIGIASVLERTELTPSQREMLTLITSAGADLEGILNDVLDLSRIAADRLKLRKEAFDVREVLSRATELFRAQAEQKGLTFSIVFGAGVSGVVLGDAQRVRQIVSNLVANAVKFTDKGSVSLSADFRDTDAGDQASGLYVQVQDTGIGVDPKALTRIFERFSQADDTITRRFGGTGLGLTISQTLAELMAGSISAVSIPGQGSTFTFHAPLQRVDLPDPPATSIHAPEVTIASPLRVLVAEDNPANQQMITLMLEAIGAEIILAQDGADALTKYQKNQVDCILMDIHMPIKDGISAIADIREFEKTTGRPRTPAAVVTADVSEQRWGEARRAGADAQLLKPIAAKKLIDCLNTLRTRVM